MSKKATKAEIETRINHISNLLVRGERYHDIVRFSAKKWNIKSRQVDNYIREARKRIFQTLETNLYYNLARAIGVRRRLFRNALKEKDYRGVFRVIE